MELFVEKYRPQIIEDCILPKKIKDIFKQYVKDGKFQNLLLCGTAGCGKTTVARALCNEIHAEILFVNASEESGIDILRTKIRRFASTTSLSGEPKVVILDEADYLNAQSTQPALRGFIEEFHDNCRFILTCNYQNRILPAIQSRCAVIDFRMNKEDKIEIRLDFIAMLHNILKAENIKYDKKVLIQIIRKHFPDIRRIINELQRYGACGEIDSGILVSLSEDKISTLIKALKDREYNVMKKWVNENIDNDSDTIFQNIYDGVHESAKNESIPIAVITIADYMYKSAFVMSQEINLVACLTELMAKCDWK